MESKSILFITIVLLSLQMTLSLKENQNQKVNPGKDNSGGNITKSAECSPLEIPMFGKMFCGGWTDLKHCSARCLPGYKFEGKEAKKMILQCKNGEWIPQNKFPKCIRKDGGQGQKLKKVPVGGITDDYYDYSDFLKHYPDEDYMYYYIL